MPNCEECEDLLDMQVYDPDTDTWTILCPECLEQYVVVEQLPITDPATTDASEYYEGGTPPEGGVAIVCGQKSKLIEHEFKKTVQYSVDGQDMPWAQSVMNRRFRILCG